MSAFWSCYMSAFGQLDPNRQREFTMDLMSQWRGIIEVAKEGTKNEEKTRLLLKQELEGFKEEGFSASNWGRLAVDCILHSKVDDEFEKKMYSSLFKELIEQGLDPDAQVDMMGNVLPLLLITIQLDEWELWEILIQKCKHINAYDSLGMGMLHYAFESAQGLENTEFLSAAGLSDEERADQVKLLKMIEELIANPNVDKNLKNQAGLTAIEHLEWINSLTHTTSKKANFAQKARSWWERAFLNESMESPRLISPKTRL